MDLLRHSHVRTVCLSAVAPWLLLQACWHDHDQQPLHFRSPSVSPQSYKICLSFSFRVLEGAQGMALPAEMPGEVRSQ